MIVKSYRDLRVRQRAMELVEACYKVTAGFLKDELYGLSSQLKRAAVSISANIAERHGRDELGGYTHFLCIAQGSLRETETHLLIAGRLALVSEDSLDEALPLSDEFSRMLGGLMRSLKNRRQTPNT